MMTQHIAGSATIFAYGSPTSAIASGHPGIWALNSAHGSGSFAMLDTFGGAVQSIYVFILHLA